MGDKQNQTDQFKQVDQRTKLLAQLQDFLQIVENQLYSCYSNQQGVFNVGNVGFWEQVGDDRDQI